MKKISRQPSKKVYHIKGMNKETFIIRKFKEMIEEESEKAIWRSKMKKHFTGQVPNNGLYDVYYRGDVKGTLKWQLPFKSYVADQFGVLHEIENSELPNTMGAIDDVYFLVEYVAGEGTTGEKREQRVMTRDEINNLNFWGYRILNITRIY